MELKVVHQPTYSRNQLLLRSIFGFFYIVIPHVFVLLFVEIALLYHYLYVTFFILIKGYYPEKSHSFIENFFHWGARLHNRVYHLNDGYPSFGLHQRDEYVFLNFPLPEKVDRKLTLLRFLFGPIFIFLPHIFVIVIRVLACFILALPAYVSVLLNQKYPKSLFEFQVDTLRYIIRVYVYFFHLSPDYPPFHGKEEAA